MYYVYIIKSKKFNKQHYVGYATNLKSRLKAHNSGKSIHTNEFKPWKLSCCLVFNNKEKALNFERYLKTGSGRIFLKNRFL